jgi:SH3-like domain-containing protein
MLKYTCLLASLFAVAALQAKEEPAAPVAAEADEVVGAAEPDASEQPEASKEVSKHALLWRHLISLGPAAKAPVSMAIRGEKPTEADLTALNKAYAEHLKVVKDDATRQQMGELQGKLETLLGIPAEFNKMLEADGIEFAYVDTKSSPLSLREKPDLTGAKKGLIPKDALVIMLSEEDGWYHVQALGNAQGYASKDYLKSIKEKACLHNAIVHTKTSPLSLREGPSQEAQKLDKMPKGETVCITGECKNGWCPVKFGDLSGYAAHEFLAVAK